MSNRLVRNSLYSTIAALGTALGGFLSMVLIARLLGPSGTGTIAYALWIVSIMVTLADFGIYQTLTRYLPELTARGDDRIAWRLAVALLRPAPVFLIAGLIVFMWRASVTSGTDLLSVHRMWWIAGVVFAAQLAANFAMGLLRGMQQFDQAAKLTILSLGLQLAAVGAGALSEGPQGALLGYCIGSLVPILALARLFGRSGPVDRGLMRRARRFALFSWAGALTLVLVWSRLEIFFIERYLGTEAVALFSIGFTFATLAAQGPLLLTGALLAHFSESYGRGGKAELESMYATATRVMAFILFPVCFGLTAILPLVLPMVYGQAFIAAVPVAAILVAGSAVGAVGSVGSQVIYAHDRSDFIFASGLVGAVLSVLAGFLIVPRFGMIGAAVARIVIHTLMFALGSWFIMRRLNLSLPLYQLGRLALAAAVSAASAYLIVVVTTPPWLAMCLAIVVAVPIYLAAVRALEALAAEDIARLKSIAGRLPSAASRPVSDLFALLHPRHNH
jgi:O-antigen/teichoic acid export membrane protein